MWWVLEKFERQNTLGCDEVTDIVDGPECVIQLDTGLGTVLRSVLRQRRTYINIGCEVLAFKLGDFGCLRHGHLDLVLALAHVRTNHEEHEDDEHDVGERRGIELRDAAFAFLNKLCHTESSYLFLTSFGSASEMFCGTALRTRSCCSVLRRLNTRP